jgi:hypothetical protein
VNTHIGTPSRVKVRANIHIGRAIAQAVSRWLPTAAARGLVKWDLWWTKWRWGRFSPSTSVSPANLYSTNCFTITLIYHLGLYNRPEVAAVPGDVSPTPLKKNVMVVSFKKLMGLLKMVY